jgi:radical SAM protein with 4Fe4S-binding SPASM domain
MAGERTGLAAAVPVEVCVDTTYACDLRCVHCNVSCLLDASRKELTADELASLFDQLAAAGAKRLVLTGGEFLIRPDWQEVAREAAKRFETRVFTNGVSVTASVAAALASVRLACVEVSVYGASAGTYEQVTGVPGSYGRFREGLRLLSEAGLRVMPKAILLRHNIAEWPQMRRQHSHDQGLASTLVITPRFDGDLGPAAHRASSEQMVEFLSLTGGARKRRRSLKDPRSAVLCDPARKGCVVSAYGDVFPCGMLPISGGNLREASFAHIWRGEFFEEVRRLSLKDAEGCADCDALPYCRPCWGMNYLERGDMRLPSPESCRLARLKKQVAETRPGRFSLRRLFARRRTGM